MKKYLCFKTKQNHICMWFLCFIALILFVLFNFEVPLAIYKLVNSVSIKLLLKHASLQNITNMLQFFTIVILISVILFITSGFVAIFIFMFRLNKIYEIFYAFNNVNNILFAPTFIFLTHTYGITKYGLFFILIFDTISNMVVLIYEFFSIELSNKLYIVKQFDKNAKPMFKYLLYVFFNKFKSVVSIYFTEVIDNAYMYAFIINTPLMLNIIESITNQTNIYNEFILGYFVLQVLTYIIFTVFYVLF